MSRMSSMTPTTKMAAAPRSRPSGSEEPGTRSSAGTTRPRPRRPAGPTNMAAPPDWGVTRWWTLRSSGWATYPIWTANRRAGKVRAHVTTAATTRSTAYQLSGTPAPPCHPAPAAPGVTPRPGRVRREAGAQLDLAADGRRTASSPRWRRVRPMRAPTRSISAGPMPAVVCAAVPRRRPEVTKASGDRRGWCCGCR